MNKFMEMERKMSGVLGNMTLLGILAVTAYRDWKEQSICLYLPLAAGIAGVLLHVFCRENSLVDIFMGVSVGLVMLLVAWLGRECVGVGDGVMLMVSGVFLGFWRNLELLLTALFLAAIAALFLLIVKRKGKGYRMPFLPFLLVAYLFQLG